MRLEKISRLFADWKSCVDSLCPILIILLSRMCRLHRGLYVTNNEFRLKLEITPSNALIHVNDRRRGVTQVHGAYLLSDDRFFFGMRPAFPPFFGFYLVWRL